jgi:hypothetical protein
MNNLENKIICSSAALKRKLEMFIVNCPSHQHDDFFEISCAGGKLTIGDYSMDVEAKREWVRSFDFKKIKEIKRLLKRIPEQPLVIEFGDGNIEILNVQV